MTKQIGIYQLSRDENMEPVGVFEYADADDAYTLLTDDPEARTWEEVTQDGMDLLAVTNKYGETFYYELPA